MRPAALPGSRISETLETTKGSAELEFRIQFPPAERCYGAGGEDHFASITAGGPAPLIATALLAWTGSGYVIALYILLSAAVTFVSAMFLPDRTNRDISQEVA